MKRTRILGLALALLASGAVACQQDSPVTAPGQGRAKFTTTSYVGFDEPTDSILVHIDLDSAGASSVALDISDANGNTTPVVGADSAWIRVPSTRPSVVYVIRPADSAVVGFGLVSTQDLSENSMHVDGEKTLRSLALMHPLAMPQTLAGVDTIAKYALGNIATATPAADLDAAMWNGMLRQGGTVQLPTSVGAYIQDVGENAANATLSAPPLHPPTSPTHQSGLPATVPWVTVAPNTGGP